MTGAGGGLRAWGSLVLLGLCSWTGARAAASSPVGNLTVEAQTSSSITLRWEAPGDSDPQVYWIWWTGGNNATGSQNTTNTSVTVEGLEAGTLYKFFVCAVRDGLNCSWVPLNASTAPNTVRNLTVETQTNSSITLRWEAPNGPEPENYWVQWTGDGNATGSQNTTNTTVTVEGLEAGTLYEFSVSAVKDGVSSSWVLLNGTTAPTEVMDLQKQNQTNSSITLRWEAPADPRPQFYVYWVQWASSGHPQRKQDPQGQQDSQTGRTNGTCYTVGALLPGTRYRFSVWAESNGVHGDKQSLNASTAPDPANIVSCVITSGGHQAILNWSCPQGGYETFELEVEGQLGPQNRSSCGSAMEVLLGRPTQPYSATVTTIWDEMRAPSASVACHVEGGPAGVIAGAVVGVLLLLVLVGLLVFFLKRHRKREKKTTPKDLQIR